MKQLTDGTQSQALTPAVNPDKLSLRETIDLAMHLAKSGLFATRGDSLEVTQSKIIARILYGQEHGFAPMTSLTGVYIVEGKLSMGAGMVSAKIMLSGFMSYTVVEHTNRVCRVDWYRRGKRVGGTVWTIEDARTANLTGKANWKKHPRSMLFARAMTEGARTYCPDIFGGPVYTPEELGAEVIEVSQSPEPAPALEPAKPTKDDERSEARAALIEVVGASGVEPKRVFKAIMAKLDKPADAITADEFAHMAERLRALDDVDAWCAHCLGEPPPPVEAEIVPDADPFAEAAEAEEQDRWDRGNKALHAEFGSYCTATGTEGDSKSNALAIVHDVARARCGLPVDAPWAEVTLEAMDFVRVHLKQTEIAQVALNTEWATIAAERGAVG
jgi:hypothetical protein